MIKLLSSLAVAGVISVGVVSPALAHEVKPGDTMNKISQQYDMSLNELAELNPQVTNLDLIYVGQTVNTHKNEVQQVSSPSQVVSKPSNSEHDLLARLVRAEAEDESFTGKVAVAEVVLNRINSSQFPNSISGVVYQSGQFSPVSNGTINSPADTDSVRAVQVALNGSNYTKGALFFYNPNLASSRWLDSKPTVAVIGNHAFK